MGGLTQAEYDAKQDFAQHALDAGINLSVDDADEPVEASGTVFTNTPTEPHSDSPPASSLGRSWA